MIIRHVSSSSWIRAFCFAYSWLTERSKCAFQAWTAREHSLCSKFILALVSSLMTNSVVCRGNSNQGSYIYHSECPGRLRHVRYNGRCCFRFYPHAFYSPSSNFFLLLSSLVALFQPNAPLPRFPLKCWRLRAGCQMLQSLPLWCYQAHEETSASTLRKCRAF